MGYVGSLPELFERSTLFSNREIAIGIWLSALVVLALYTRSYRRTICGISRTFTSPQISIVFLMALIYVLIVNLALVKYDVWTLSIAKNSSIWFIAGAISSILVSATALDVTSSFRSKLMSLVKLSFLMELVVGFKSFPLAAEMILVPVATLVFIAIVLSENNQEFRKAKMKLEVTGAVIGFGLFGYGVFSIAAQYRSIDVLDTLTAILFIPILSLSFIPYLYLVALYSGYDQIFRRIGAFTDNREHIRKYTMFRLALRVNVRLSKLAHLSKAHSGELMRISDCDDVNILIDGSSCH